MIPSRRIRLAHRGDLLWLTRREHVRISTAAASLIRGEHQWQTVGSFVFGNNGRRHSGGAAWGPSDDQRRRTRALPRRAAHAHGQ